MRSPFVLKSVFRRFGRYGFLATMIAFGILAVTLIQALTLGMRNNVIEGSARYLGGRFVLVARKESLKNDNLIEDSSKIESALALAGIHPWVTVKRETAIGQDQSLYFNGYSMPVRRMTGVDFRAEAEVFSKLEFISGGLSGMAASGGLIISKQMAERFGARKGDSMTFRLTNTKGCLTTAELTVRGIFKDASIFGYYTAYMDIEDLRRLRGDVPESIPTMGFYFSGPAGKTPTATQMNAALAAAGFDIFPWLNSRKDLESHKDSHWTGTKYVVLPVEKYIDTKVMDLISAIQLVSYLFLGMVLVIILVGMRNTTQIMTRRRTREIGTIRALGMSQGGAVRLVLGEALLVASIGFSLGVLATALILSALAFVPFSWSNGFDIFLSRGHLTWRFSLLFLGANYLSLTIMTLFGSLPAAMRAARITPAQALAAHDQ